MSEEKFTHFIGIGGIGMSGLARILLQQGHSVSGSDLKSQPALEKLKAEGAKIYIGHDDLYVCKDARVVYSTDIKEDNKELVIAKKRGQRLLHRSHLLKELFGMQKPLLVTGTHGKTTTSSLLSHALKHMGYKPSFAVGGIIKAEGMNAQYGSGEYFVAEADESDKSFLTYKGFGAIITNIGLDHLNYWHTEKELVEGFKQFAQNVENKDRLVFCYDDLRLRALHLPGYSYGFSAGADAQIVSFSQNGFITSFDVSFKGQMYSSIQVPLIGRHNVLNACSVFILCLLLGAEVDKIKAALMTFQGVARRSDRIGQAGGALFYDDYGHHPTEITATIAAFKDSLPQARLVAVFQPHRYTRTRDCFEGFVDAFAMADVLVLTDIYSASEDPIEGISSEELYQAIKNKHRVDSYYIRSDVLCEFLSHFIQEGDVVLTIGAGDITTLGPKVMERIQAGV